MKILQVSILFLLCVLQPSHAAIVILNGLTHVHTTSSGGQINGKIVVRNDGAKESRIIIYKQDLLSNCQSAFEYKETASHKRTLGNWLKTNVDEKLLAPSEEYTIFYTIDVPKDLKENGSFWSVLMVEGAEPVREEFSKGMQVNSKVRYAVQVITDVGIVQNPKLTFDNLNLKKVDSKTTKIDVKIKNDGFFSTRANVLVEIYNAKGEKIKTYNGLAKRIYPGNCNLFEIELMNLPKGKYDGVVIADNGKDLFGTNIVLDL